MEAMGFDHFPNTNPVVLGGFHVHLRKCADFDPVVSEVRWPGRQVSRSFKMDISFFERRLGGCAIEPLKPRYIYIYT